MLNTSEAGREDSVQDLTFLTPVSALSGTNEAAFTSHHQLEASFVFRRCNSPPVFSLWGDDDAETIRREGETVGQKHRRGERDDSVAAESKQVFFSGAALTALCESG